jgi:hypothetical protein
MRQMEHNGRTALLSPGNNSLDPMTALENVSAGDWETDESAFRIIEEKLDK